MSPYLGGSKRRECIVWPPSSDRRSRGAEKRALLDDEVIFEPSSANAREAAPNIDYGSEQIDIIEYALDDPLVPPYEYMMEIGEADRPRAFPSTIGKTRFPQVLRAQSSVGITDPL